MLGQSILVDYNLSEPLEFGDHDVLEARDLWKLGGLVHALGDPGLKVGVLLGAGRRKSETFAEFNEFKACLKVVGKNKVATDKV